MSTPVADLAKKNALEEIHQAFEGLAPALKIDRCAPIRQAANFAARKHWHNLTKPAQKNQASSYVALESRLDPETFYGAI